MTGRCTVCAKPAAGGELCPLCALVADLDVEAVPHGPTRDRRQLGAAFLDELDYLDHGDGYEPPLDDTQRG